MNLKYRIRNRETGKIFDPVLINHSYDSMELYVEPYVDITVLSTDVESLCRSDVSDGYTVEVFTGLHDKYGNEIYEGDRIKHIGSKDVWTVCYDLGFACFVAEKIDHWEGKKQWQLDAERMSNYYEVVEEES